jgi:hypothetical protein
MTVLKCTNKPDLAKHGEMQFPLIGRVKFDKDNQIEVSDELVEKFLAVQCGHTFHVIKDGVDQTKAEEKQVEEPISEEKQMYAEELGKLNINELNVLFNAESSAMQRISIRKAVDKIAFLVKKKYPS